MRARIFCAWNLRRRHTRSEIGSLYMEPLAAGIFVARHGTTLAPTAFWPNLISLIMMKILRRQSLLGALAAAILLTPITQAQNSGMIKPLTLNVPADTVYGSISLDLRSTLLSQFRWMMPFGVACKRICKLRW